MYIVINIVIPLNFSTYLSFLRQSLKLLYSEQEKNGGVGVGGGRQHLEEGGGLDCGIPRQALVKDVNVFRQRDSFSGLLVTIVDAVSSSVRTPPPEFEVMFSPVSGFKRFVSEGTLAKRITGLEVCMQSSLGGTSVIGYNWHFIWRYYNYVYNRSICKT
jgi:hypothetical protein